MIKSLLIRFLVGVALITPVKATVTDHNRITEAFIFLKQQLGVSASQASLVFESLEQKYPGETKRLGYVSLMYVVGSTLHINTDAAYDPTFTQMDLLHTLSHEMGHIVLGHTYVKGAVQDQELEADRFAINTLLNMGYDAFQYKKYLMFRFGGDHYDEDHGSNKLSTLSNMQYIDDRMSTMGIQIPPTIDQFVNK